MNPSMKWLNNISLKFKLAILLVTLTCTMLSAYGYLALRDFERDKLAYVQDTSRSYSRSAALQIRTELSYVADRLRTIMSDYNADTSDFSQETKSLFNKESNFDALLSYQYDSPSGQYRLKKQLSQHSLGKSTLLALEQMTKNLVQRVLQDEVVIQRTGEGHQWFFGLRIDDPERKPVVIFSYSHDANFFGLFDTAQIQDTYLVNSSGSLILQPTENTYDTSPAEISTLISELFSNSLAAEGTREIKTDKTRSWLVSFARIGLGDIQVVSIISRNAALQAVKILVTKSVLFLAFLFFLTVFLSLLSSISLTSSLKKLLQATNEIARGNFKVNVEIRSRDEIGSLSKGFQTMAEEIQRLMNETAEKARMENELKTAQLVQHTLFPNDAHVDLDFEIRGYYEPASECSGDWWYYKRIGHKTLFCIGDATGHGVSAALLTSAARSAATTLEQFPDMSLDQMMSVFNRAIYNTSRGNVLMTFFLGCYNHENGEVTFCNASHEPPFLIPNKTSIRKQDLLPLTGEIGARLGESPDTQYAMTQIQLQPGEQIVLYTDGVTELKNKAGAVWGERSLLKCLIKCSNEQRDLQSTMHEINEELSTFREKHPLHDDITFFMVKRPSSDQGSNHHMATGA